jgi:recombination protein RecT
MTDRTSLREQAAADQGKTIEPQSEPTIGKLIERMEGEFATAMPKGLEAQQLVRDALTVLQQTPGLANVDGRTVLGGLMTCAQLGLRPGVLGQAWLIPMKGKAQLIIGYQGYAELAYRSGVIRSLRVDRIYRDDRVALRRGVGALLVINPPWPPLPLAERGDAIAYSASVEYVNGGTNFQGAVRDGPQGRGDRRPVAGPLRRDGRQDAGADARPADAEVSGVGVGARPGRDSPGQR